MDWSSPAYQLGVNIEAQLICCYWQLTIIGFGLTQCLLRCNRLELTFGCPMINFSLQVVTRVSLDCSAAYLELMKRWLVGLQWLYGFRARIPLLWLLKWFCQFQKKKKKFCNRRRRKEMEFAQRGRNQRVDDHKEENKTLTWCLLPKRYSSYEQITICSNQQSLLHFWLYTWD